MLSNKVIAAVFGFLATLRSGYEQLKNKIDRVAHGETVFVSNGKFSLPAKVPEFATANRGQLGFRTVIAAVTVVVAVMVVTIVLDSLDQALGTPDNSDLDNASNDVLTGFADMASLVAPLLIVAIAVVIIGLVRQTRGA